MKFHLETLSNEGLQFEQNVISFDIQGKMDAILVTTRNNVCNCWCQAAPDFGYVGLPSIYGWRATTGRTPAWQAGVAL